ncbi:uncharacterized protein [Triticum aestivum]|uniref:uncharacterized protein n=1 Tax=Triticum aestivum TaxID=4565 RepID=UPI001D02E499|nr:uncharacterized protein LOC123091276 [Triticum aestivum]
MNEMLTPCMLHVSFFPHNGCDLFCRYVSVRLAKYWSPSSYNPKASSGGQADASSPHVEEKDDKDVHARVTRNNWGSSDNFRSEELIFDIVPFRNGYHALLGRTAFAKFNAVPHYAYLKLKMLGPRGVITVKGNIERSL